MENRFQKRKPNRLNGFDYSKNGAYFITICTKDKKCVLSSVVGEGLCALPQIHLTPIGKEIEKSIKYINDNYIDISVDKYIIMPNHIHLLIEIDGAMRASPPTISSLIRSFKGLTTKEIGVPIFQRSFYDHIIRNEEDYLNVWEYINSNAQKWQMDKYYITR